MLYFTAFMATVEKVISYVKRNVESLPCYLEVFAVMALLAPLGLRELTLCVGEMPPDARVMWHQQEKIILGEIRTQNRSLETKTICSMKQA